MQGDHPASGTAFLMGGEVGALMRANDWSVSPLGPPETWPQPLQTLVGVMLSSRQPMFVIWGRERTLLYNDSYIPILGRRHPTALGRPIAAVWYDVVDKIGPIIDRAYAGEGTHMDDIAFTLYRNGYAEEAHFAFSYTPVRDEAGHVTGMFCACTETTEQVLTQRALARTQERLSHALNASGMVGTFDWHVASDTFYSDARFAALYGVDPVKGESGTPISDYMSGVHPDDRERIAAAVQHAIATGATYAQEYRLLQKDGSVRWIEARGECLYDESGKPFRFPGVVVDITARRRAEDALRRLVAIIESSDDGIIGMDTAAIVTSWNKGAERLYGYRAEEVIGIPVTILLPDDRRDEEQAILDRISRGERVHHYDTVRRRKDGGLVEISLTVSPVRDAQGRVIGASKVARDITERRQAERLQRTLMNELKHRVKNILATVQAIARQTFRADQGDSIARATFEARLLALSHAHDLLTRENWSGASIATVVAEALAPYQRERFQISGPEVHLSPKAALALTLALHELATNAAKYGALSVPSGRVAITWSVASGDQSYLSFRWQESGGPLVSAPTRKGFGSRLIERSMAMELGGEVRTTYDPAGVVCEVSAPLAARWETSTEEAA